MLTIEEIKKELDAGNTVELECVDREEYLNLEKNWRESRQEILDSSLVVTGLYGINENNLEIKGTSRIILSSQLYHFRIKRPTPTFDDLIDVAVQGVKNNVIFMDSFCVDNVRFESVVLVEDERTFDIYLGDSSDVIADAIEYIKSLYTETFVIDDIESLQKVKIDASGILANGSKFKVNRAHGQYSGKGKLYIEFESETTNHASLEVLKGATVTQKRCAL